MPRQNSFEDDSLVSEVVFEKLVIEEDSDHIIQDLERLPFVQIKVLGSGQSASVDEVRYTHTGAVFARKTITFPGLRDRHVREEYFNNEVSIMRNLKGHRHIIKLYATWVWKKQFGLILDPAANGGSLDHYLVNYWEALEKPNVSKIKIETMRMGLERAFGCLANGLAYIHKHGIRHRDIKPPNILMHDHLVIITDFGASKDTIQTGENTTEGFVDQQTPKYSAPEVVAFKKRSFEADVYSLGCVYIELLSILSKAIGHDIELSFSKTMDDLHAEIFGVELPSRLEFLRSIILSMTLKDRESRAKITSVAADICQQDGFHCDECKHVPQTAQSYSSCSEWVYDTEQQLHYCYMMDEEGKEIGHMWEGDPHTMVFYRSDGPSDDTQSNVTESEYGAPYLLSALRPLLPSVISGEDIESEFKYRRVRKSSHAEFFVLGRVFKMLWTETAVEAQAGSSKSKASSHISVEANAAGDYNEIRRFVVVSNKGQYSQCIPIQPVRHRRNASKTGKASFNPEHYGIIHTSLNAPGSYPEETITKLPIRVIAAQGQMLKHESRLNYSKQKSVEHNVKVIDIGMVADEHKHLVLAYFEGAMRG